jgi:hypothetical protein
VLYREIIAACTEIRTKHINTLCGQKVELLDLKNLLVRKELQKITAQTRIEIRPLRNQSQPITQTDGKETLVFCAFVRFSVRRHLT